MISPQRDYINPAWSSNFPPGQTSVWGSVDEIVVDPKDHGKEFRWASQCIHLMICWTLDPQLHSQVHYWGVTIRNCMHYACMWDYGPCCDKCVWQCCPLFLNIGVWKYEPLCPIFLLIGAHFFNKDTFFLLFIPCGCISLCNSCKVRWPVQVPAILTFRLLFSCRDILSERMYWVN